MWLPPGEPASPVELFCGSAGRRRRRLPLRQTVTTIGPIGKRQRRYHVEIN
jgi:hypothetical protein